MKMRMGWQADKINANELIPRIKRQGVSAVSIHGRTRKQRYLKDANWDYMRECASSNPEMQVVGNGDIYTFEDYNTAMTDSKFATVLIARGALIKPWLFTEIKEQKHWDISSSERFEMYKRFTNYGLELWGSDTRGIASTRRFLLEALSFWCRYVPVGLLERQYANARLNWRSPSTRIIGRDDLETLMASDRSSDWVKITEMLLGKVPDEFHFAPKHKSKSVESENATQAR
jgi:tRNA-dihydrouridine synthase 3